LGLRGWSCSSARGHPVFRNKDADGNVRDDWVRVDCHYGIRRGTEHSTEGSEGHQLHLGGLRGSVHHLLGVQVCPGGAGLSGVLVLLGLEHRTCSSGPRQLLQVRAISRFVIVLRVSLFSNHGKEGVHATDSRKTTSEGSAKRSLATAIGVGRQQVQNHAVQVQRRHPESAQVAPPG